MRGLRRPSIVCLVAVLGALGCTQGASPAASPGGSPAQPASPLQVKRVTAAMMGQPSSFIARMNTTQITIPGVGDLEQLVNACLSELNGETKLQPQLAEAVPSLDNGLWQLLPDGRMTTTWKIRSGAQWQDGAPFTADDLVFTATVDQDKSLPVVRPAGYAWVEKVEALDPSTVMVTWNRPYVDADTMFTNTFASPLPKHLLEDAYNTDKQGYLTLPYWGQAFVGTGPFAVREFLPGTSITLQANDRYVLGRPKIDEIQIHFVLDLDSLVTDILAGSTELTIGRGFTTDRGIELRDRWPEGQMLTNPKSWVAIYPQFINPSPSIVDTVQFRQALMYATDREQLAQTLQRGLSPVANTYLSPTSAEYQEAGNDVVTYPYDPRKAASLLDDLGYTRGADGAYRDSTGERLSLELRSNGEPITERAIIPVADFWTSAGIPTDPVLVPPQRIVDREYVATFPSFRMMRQPDRPTQISRAHGSLTPLPENGYVGTNYSRYMNPEFDGLIDRYLSTIPWTDRMQVLRQAMRHISEQLNMMGLFYDPDVEFASNRLLNVGINDTEVWNVHLWDVQL